MAAVSQIGFEEDSKAAAVSSEEDFPSLAVMPADPALNEAALNEYEPPLGVQGGVHAKVGKNVSVTVLARVGYMLTRILIPPFVLAHIGLEAYGIWTTAFIVVGYLGLSTLGVSNVYIKYVAEYNARREYQKVNELLSSGLMLTLPLCSALYACIYFGWNHLAPFLKIPPQYASAGKEALLITTAVFLSSIATNAFNDVLTGVQDIAAAQWIWIISYLVEGVLIFMLISHGRGIRGMAEAYLGRILVNDVLTYLWMRHTLPWIRFSPRLVRKEALHQVMHFGGMVQLQSMLDIFLNSIERVLALSLLGVSAAGLMDLCKKWPASVSTVPMAFFGAMLPAASHVDAHGSKEARLQRLRDLYLQGARYSNLSTAYFAGLMLSVPAAILHVWLKQPLPYAGALFAVFTIWLQFHMLTGPGTSVLRGMGRVYDEFYYSIPNVIFLAVTVPAVYFLGGHHWSILGVGLAVMTSTIFSSLVLLWRAHSVLEQSWTLWFTHAIAPGFLFYAVGAAVAWPVAHLVNEVGRLEGASVLAAAGLIYTAVSLALLYQFILGPDERAKVGQKFASWRYRAVTA
jgi:O-antigen/teichoic acid export membrane protein